MDCVYLKKVQYLIGLSRETNMPVVVETVYLLYAMYFHFAAIGTHSWVCLTDDDDDNHDDGDDKKIVSFLLS